MKGKDFMNNDTLIRESLLYKNRENHEESECRHVFPAVDIEGCDWVNIEDIGAMPQAALPIYLDDSRALFTKFSHATVIGSTGTGKSEVIVKNMLQIFSRYPDDKKPSFVASDLKGDISRQLYSQLKNSGYEVIVMDMKRPYQSSRYNFMSRIYDDHHEAVRLRRMLAEGYGDEYEKDGYSSKEEAINAVNAKIYTLTDNVEKAIDELANIIIVCNDNKDLSWFQGARTMFSAIVLTLLKDSENEKNGMTREAFTIANVCRAAFHTDDDCEEIISWLRRADELLTVQNAITGNYELRAKVTRDGYISTINTALGAYTTNAIGVLTESSDDIDLREVAKREKPYAIFLITDDRQKVTNSIAMMFINDLVAELTQYADSRDYDYIKRDFVFLLDEFANMPPMPEMSRKITTLRSRRMWMIMAIQSIQQLSQVYGSETCEIILDNCDMSIFLGSNNLSTKEIFANSMGQRAGISASYQKGNDGNTSESVTTANIPVVRISDLERLTLGEFYIRARAISNLKSSMIPYFLRMESSLASDYKDGMFRHYDPRANLYNISDVLKREEEERTSSASGRKFNFNF